MVVFDRPIGAQADVKELEYISALHQSGVRLRSDGSIRDEDIKVYLRSRFGIEVTLEEVRQTILQGLGGGGAAGGSSAGDDDDDDEGEVIDLVELTAIILIPLLLKAAAVEKGQDLPSDAVPSPEQLLETVVQIILHDVAGTHDDAQQRKLTPEFLHQILKVYGEIEMAQDETLIQEMIQAASDTDGGTSKDTSTADDNYFDVRTFAEALTKDVQLYDIENEVRISTSVQDVFEHKAMMNEQEASCSTHFEDTHISADDPEQPPHTSTTTCSSRQQVRRRTSSTREALMESTNEMRLQKHPVREIETLRQFYTAPAIDIQAGTYRSKALTVSLWGCILFGLFSIAIELQMLDFGQSSCAEGGAAYDSNTGWSDNRQAIFCHLGSSVIGWVFIFGGFCLAGIFSMGVGSLGNYIGNTRWYLPLIGAGYSICFSFAFLNSEPSASYFTYISVLSKLLSVMVAYFHMCHVVTIIFPNVDFETSKWGRRFGAAALGNELHVKTAGAHKLNQLVSNASTLMRYQGNTSVYKTFFSHGVSAFTVNGVSHEKAGGFLWLLRRIRDQSIFEKEGIWYSTRLVASNFAQITVSLFIMILGVSVIRQVKENFGVEQAQAQISSAIDYFVEMHVSEAQTHAATTELTSTFTAYLANVGTTGLIDLNCSAYGIETLLIDDLCEHNDFGLYNCSGIESPEESLCVLIENPDLPEQDSAAAYQLLKGSGFNDSAMEGLVRSQLQDVLDEATESLYPEEEYMITIPLSAAVIVAITTALRLAMAYLPGVTTTILKLRTGVIPSLHSPDFEKYRVAPDTVTMLTGSLFWGCLVSSLLFGLVIGFIVFLFLWQGSAYFVMRLIAVIVGVVCIVVIRLLIVVFCCRKQFYKGLYRTKPAASNISMLALEWANFVFTPAFILVRMVKLILVAVASIGQVDRRLLADDVGQVGPIEFDPYPTIHLRELVAHEAHRHPYIEILGTMYLMKLRYAKHFGNRAGSAWRLVFVYALLPWMHQYRILEPRENEHGQVLKKDGGNEDDEAIKAEEENPDSRRLPTLERRPSTNARALEVDNDRLKQMVQRMEERIERLSQQLRDSQIAS